MAYLRAKKLGVAKDIAEALDLPMDAVLDLPRLILTGNLQLVVENHRGIIEYTGERLRVSLSVGELMVQGSGLVIRRISMDELVVEGHISAVSFGAGG